jgi:4-amino-4-deoxy-L-arabinose transferase-like glycosyltransferase
MGKKMNRSGQWWLVGWTLAATLFRSPGLFANHFHADEALFAGFARTIAVWRDPLLQLQPVDKPPLLFYAQALFYPLFGPVEFAARLPNFVVSILLVPLTGVLAWQLFGEEKTAVFAATIIACLPLTIQFSPTAFLDPFLTFWLVAALVALVSRKLGVSGVLFGLAVMTKYQAWLFAPLLLGLGWRWRWSNWRWWLAGFVPVMLLLVAWEVARGGINLWPAQMANFGGVRLSWSWELWPRGREWLLLGQQVLGSTWLAAAVVILLAGAGVRAWRGRDWQAGMTLLLLLFITGYLLLHWLLAIPVWDRYLLPLLPLVVVVVSHQLSVVIDTLARSTGFSRFFPLKRALRTVVVGVLLILLLVGAWGARNGRYPIGSQRKADQGAAVVAETLADAPYGTVLYDHWYSWQWRYHLFDRRVYVSWQPYPAALAEEMAVFGADGSRRYLVLPDSAAARPFIRAVESAGFVLQPVVLLASTQMRLYEIVPHE